MYSLIPDVKPPNPPWIPINKGASNIATISYYYSDPKSLVVPIRDVTSTIYAKYDPNLETLTYGLFSHCCKPERKAIVKKGVITQFFCTKRANNIRVLTGYYHPAWYCEIGPGDYAIAAESARFVSPGFAFDDLTDFLEGHLPRFRTWGYIRGEKLTWRLMLLINSAPDATKTYLSEIRKFESSALEQNGSIYENRKKGFSWEDAGLLLRKKGLI
jgi:hypothetical protein